MPNEPPADPQAARIERIKTLTQTARTTWFGYLGAFTFAGITLLGVEDSDFFSAEAQTELPLVGVTVPVPSFFFAGSLLIAVIYGYLHVFLEKLWVELGELEDPGNGETLSQIVAPWLVSDFALQLKLYRSQRGWLPKFGSPLGVAGRFVSLLLCWVSGPAILAGFWLRSMPAHDAWLTGSIGVLFAITFWAMCASLRSLWRRIEAPRDEGHGLLLHVAMIGVLVAASQYASMKRTVDDCCSRSLLT